jgi:hypothetical protein
MDIVKVTAALDAAATESDPAMADRLVLVYVAPGSAGMVIHRIGHGTHVLTAGGQRHEFKAKIMGAIDALWPDLAKQTRTYLRIGADFIANSGQLARHLGGGGDE